MDYLKLPRIIKTPADTIYENTIYSGRYDFKLNHNIGPLYQCFIKATLSTSGASNTLKSNFGLKILKSIRLHNNSSTLAKLDPNTAIARLDLMSTGYLASKIIATTQPPVGAFLSQSVFVYIPLMFWFSDKPELALDLKGRNQLFIEIITNSDRSSIGMSTDLTSAKYELISYHRESFDTIPRELLGTYSSFNEKNVFLPLGSTSAIINLTCPYPVFYLHFQIISITSNKSPITNVKLDIPNMTLMDLNPIVNYSMSDDDQEISNNLSSTVSLKFGQRHGSEKQFIKFSQEMMPSNATIIFSTLAENCYLYTTCEYYNNLITSGPDIITDNSGLFYTTQIQ